MDHDQWWKLYVLLGLLVNGESWKMVFSHKGELGFSYVPLRLRVTQHRSPLTENGRVTVSPLIFNREHIHMDDHKYDCEGDAMVLSL